MVEQARNRLSRQHATGYPGRRLQRTAHETAHARGRCLGCAIAGRGLGIAWIGLGIPRIGGRDAAGPGSFQPRDGAALAAA